MFNQNIRKKRCAKLRKKNENILEAQKFGAGEK